MIQVKLAAEAKCIYIYIIQRIITYLYEATELKNIKHFEMYLNEAMKWK